MKPLVGPVPIGSAYDNYRRRRLASTCPVEKCWCFLGNRATLFRPRGGGHRDHQSGLDGPGTPPYWLSPPDRMVQNPFCHIGWYSKHCISQLCHVQIMLSIPSGPLCGTRLLDRHKLSGRKDDDTPKSLDRMRNARLGFQRIPHQSCPTSFFPTIIGSPQSHGNRLTVPRRAHACHQAYSRSDNAVEYKRILWESSLCSSCPINPVRTR